MRASVMSPIRLLSWNVQSISGTVQLHDVPYSHICPRGNEIGRNMPAGFVCLAESDGTCSAVSCRIFLRSRNANTQGKGDIWFYIKGVWVEMDNYDVEMTRQALLKMKASLNPTYRLVRLLPLQPLPCNRFFLFRWRPDTDNN